MKLDTILAISPRILFLGIVALMTSCEKIDHGFNQSNSFKSIDDKDEITLGERLNDPYNIVFITTAYNQMKKEGADFPFSEITPTGMYVRLLANSTHELDAIEDDTTTLWFDFPLDYDIPEGGTYYHDSSLPDSATWKYAVVPLDYKFPNNIYKELLYYVFIPDEHPDYQKYESTFDELEELSEFMCNNKNKSANEQGTSGTKCSKWAPSATIRAWDDIVNAHIPLEGVKVTARHYTKLRYGYTNSEGKYTFKKEFKNGHRVKYGITWENCQWDIRNAWGIQQYYNGPKKNGAWELNINGQKSLMFATMHRALYKAFYKYWGNINRPYSTHKLKIGYKDSYNSKTLARNICTWNVFGLLNNITVFGRDSNDNFLSTNDIFGNLTHELGHQSMLRFVGGTWNYAVFSYTNFIRESYANCVEWELTSHHYKHDLGISNYSHRYHYQWWKNKEKKSSYYTPVFIDLMDGHSQNQNGYGYKDNVSGYTLIEIQNLLIESSYGASSLRITLKSNLLHGTTADDVDELIDNYKNTGF